MSLLSILGFGRKEEQVNFQKYVDSLSSDEFKKLYDSVQYRNLRERLDETRRILAYQNTIIASLAGRPSSDFFRGY